MKNLFLIVLFSLVSTVAAQAGEWNDWSWSKVDVAREVVSAGVTVIDWGQTRDIRNHQGMIELNPILGRTPGNGSINSYFGAVLLIHPVISALLPTAARPAWQYIYIGVEAAAISSNYHGGLRLSF